jgi:dolichol-phosphate mannosyltransferase
MPDTLLFVPTYNERDNAPRMARELADLGLDADILFVDDNSPDGTGALLDALRTEIPRLRVHHRAGKLGIGSAHAETIAWAYSEGYTRLVSLDCDFTHSPRDIPTLLAAAQQSDLAVGSRWVHPDSLPGWNLYRRLMTFLGHALTKYVLDIPQDASGAFRVYRLDRIPREIFGLIRSKSYAFFFESMFIFNRNKLSIREVPITLPARTYGSSKMSFQAASQGARYIFELAFQNTRKPERFLLPSGQLDLDPSLNDPQNWDNYWNESGRTANPIYEFLAGLYRRQVIKPNLERIVRREFPSGSSLLHAGCGSGQVDTGLQDTHQLTAVDISRGALSLYCRNNRNVKSVFHGDIFNLSFPADFFDGVYNLGVMEHFTAEEIQKILREFHRVLKPNGKVVLFWPHTKAPSVLLLKACRAFIRTVSETTPDFHPPEISLLSRREDWEKTITQSGFKILNWSITARDFWVQAILICQKV